MPSTTGFDFGELVLVTFPFTNQQGVKQRPAAVISSRAYHDHRPDLILSPVTSQVRNPPGFGETLLADWREAGLLKPSCVKPVLFTMENGLVRKRLGKLSRGIKRRFVQASNG